MIDSSGGNFADVPGATAASLTVTATLADDASLWRVVVNNAAGSATSIPARLSVAQGTIAPAISADPRDQSVTAGQTASFTVAASGSPTPSVQWQQRADASTEWSDIEGATALTHTTAPTTLAQSGSQYRAVVSNSAGSATSLAATLTVSADAIAPAITSQPQSQNVQAGNAALFTVTASGTSPLGYQWFNDGVAIVGANASELLLPTTAADAGRSLQISVQVSNAAGSVTSAAAVLTVVAVVTDPPVTVLIDAAQGGEVRGSGDVVLLVPAGALTTNTSVTLQTLSSSEITLPDDTTLVGRAVSISPAGLNFTSPAALGIPIPQDLVLAEGQVLALIELSDVANVNVAAKRSPASTKNRNLRRLAASSTHALPGAAMAAVGDTASLACLSPESILGGSAVVSLLTGGRKAVVTAPRGACAPLPAQAPKYGVPSSTTEACANDADYGGVGDETLFNRHVQCAGRVGDFTPVDRWNADGLTDQNVGEVTLDTRLAVYGKSSAGLQKSVQLKIGYTYTPRGTTFPAPTLRLKAVFGCTGSENVSCDNVTSVENFSPGASSGTFNTTLTFNWPDQSSVLIARTNLATVRLFFTVDGSLPGDARGGRTYNINLDFPSPQLRCDINQARARTSGCVFVDAAAVFQILPTDPQAQSRKHIKDAFAGLTTGLTDLPPGTVLSVPGKFALQPGTRAIAAPGSALQRTRDRDIINQNRRDSNSRCKRLFGPPPAATPEVCEVVTDVDDVPGPCDCDEYPFASSLGGASLVENDQYTVRRIGSSDNRSTGGKLGATFSTERVLNDEVFWVAVPD